MCSIGLHNLKTFFQSLSLWLHRRLNRTFELSVIPSRVSKYDSSILAQSWDIVQWKWRFSHVWNRLFYNLLFSSFSMISCISIQIALISVLTKLRSMKCTYLPSIFQTLPDHVSVRLLGGKWTSPEYGSFMKLKKRRMKNARLYMSVAAGLEFWICPNGMKLQNFVHRGIKRKQQQSLIF